MSTYDFDTPIERHHTGAIKYDSLASLYGRSDLLPLWVADMDFATPPFIMEALRRRLEHPVLGYTLTPPDYWSVVREWIAAHHDWTVDERWLTFIPGVIKGVGAVINVFLKDDEKVIIQPPVYHPFRLTPEGNHREVVYNPLIEQPDGTYRMDFDQLARVADDKCRLLLLSNPHNPGGILWGKETLQRLADFCYERHIIVVSDEIHCDMALRGKRHIPFATVSEKAAACSITFAAPSKTFNIAGVVSSYAVVPNAELRTPFYHWLTANELNQPTLFAPIATLAAFREGETWRREMLHYVEGNVDYVIDFCQRHLPEIRPLRPEASFLIWMDCRALGLSRKDLVALFVDKARLALNDGAIFGPGGEGFMRLNVGAPRATIVEAMTRLERAVRG